MALIQRQALAAYAGRQHVLCAAHHKQRSALWPDAAAAAHCGRPLKELAAELPGECVCLSEAELGLLDMPGASTSAVAVPGKALRGGASESGLVSCTVPCARSRRRLRVGGGGRGAGFRAGHGLREA